MKAKQNLLLWIAGVLMALLALPGMLWAWSCSTRPIYFEPFADLTLSGAALIGCYGFSLAAGVTAIVQSRAASGAACRVIGAAQAAFLAVGLAASLLPGNNPDGYMRAAWPLALLTALYIVGAVRIKAADSLP